MLTPSSPLLEKEGRSETHSLWRCHHKFFTAPLDGARRADTGDRGPTPLLPVNWRGDGQEFAMLSGNVREGGMIDGTLRRVVMFPDDRHPDLAYYVTNVTGDARDEIILWDQDQGWIYTQDRAGAIDA